MISNLVLALPALLLGLAAGAVTWFSWARGVSRLTDVVRSIASGDSSARAPEAGPMRLRGLARSVNALAEHSELLIQRELEAVRLAQTVREAGTRIRAHLDFSGTIREAVSAVEEIVPNDAAYLHLIRDGKVQPPEGHKGDWILPDAFLEDFPSHLLDYLTSLLANNTSLVSHGTDNPDYDVLPPEKQAMLRSAGIVARLATPFGIDSTLAGIIVALRTRPREPWTAAEIGAFESIAADLGRALAHARQYEDRNRVVRELRALNQSRSDFIATVSHELRAPLTSITGYIELLEDQSAGTLTGAQRRMLDTIARSSERLRSLIEDVLMLSKIESKAFRTTLRPLDLSETLTSAVAALKPTAAAAGLTLTTECAPGKTLISGDANQLDRALLNLLANAIKFTPENGRIQVLSTVGCETAEVTVRDSGIGIPEEDQEHLFSTFYRASNAMSKSIPGTGLGLSIVRTIVANHGGAISVESREGHGTAVTLRLPLLNHGVRP